MSQKTRPGLVDLFLCAKKKDLRRLAPKAFVTEDEFVEVIILAHSGHLPYKHRISHREFQPEHLKLNDKDMAAFDEAAKGGDPAAVTKTMSKVRAMFSERRILVGHMFWTPDHRHWHFIYFDQRDYRHNDNHWAGGSHFHLINHLWPGLTAQGVWNDFHQGNPEMKGSVHISWEYGRHRRQNASD